MVSNKVPNASSIRKIECDSSIQTYATVKKYHGPCTCEIVHHYSTSKIESSQNVSYETLMAHLSLNISWTFVRSDNASSRKMYISLSSLCRLIWKHWTTKMLVRYMMPSVCLRLRQFSQLSLYSLYGAVCLQLTQFSCDDRENVYFILSSSSNRKYESLTIV